MKYYILICILFATVFGRKGFGPTDQEWGFVDIRETGHMFWWLHYTTAQVADVTEKPLIIWLQGGPGGDSTGFGNFGELGPLDENLNERETSWVKNANVLFVDNPVGTGFSYCDSTSACYAVDNRQIADDFLVLLKGFFKENPRFVNTPLYILCESYGGKMTAEIALVLDQAIKAGEITANFKGVGLGDSWISPIDSVMTWAPYLLQFGALDALGYAEVEEAAARTKKAVDEGRFDDATDAWSNTEFVVMSNSHSDFYNVVQRLSINDRSRQTRDAKQDKIDEIMVNQVAPALNIPKDVHFGSQGGLVFQYLAGDFMKPVTDIVESLLNTTSLKVTVYNGQFDLIVDTPGTIKWVDTLKWEDSAKWTTTTRSDLIVNSKYEGYEKHVGNLAFFWVDRAGHMVPADNPVAMEAILKDLTNNFSKN